LSKVQDVRKHGHISLIARIIVAVVAILLAFYGQDWARLAEIFGGLNPWWFALCLATFAVAQVLISIRWWLLLRAQSIYISVFAAIRLFFLGLFYNNVMPGAVGGDVLKAWYITKHTHRRLEGALSVLVDRVIGLAGLVLMAVFTYSLFMRGRPAGKNMGEERAPGGWLSQHEGAVLWLGLGIAVVLAVLMLAHPAGRRILADGARRLQTRGLALLKRTKDALIVYCAKPGPMFAALILTFISQSMVIASFWPLGRNLGIDVEMKYYFVIFPIMWVVAAVPISPAGLGIFEWGTKKGFVALTGADPGSALALALCQRLVWLLASLPGVLIHLLGAHLPREISVDGREDLT
jgi:uncharacterized membrane protein YbhN (UPF0104 family)